MKILISSDMYRHQVNGVSSSVILLTDELRKLGHEVKVLALSDSNTSYRDGDDYYIASLNARIYPDARVTFSIRNPLLRELTAWQPDIAHIQTEFSTRTLAKHIVGKLGIPFVMTLHTDYEEYIRTHSPLPIPAPTTRLTAALNPTRQLTAFFDRTMYRGASTLIVPSYKIKALARTYHVRCPISVIPTGIDPERYPIRPEEAAETRRSLGLPENGKLLVTVTRVSKEKNIEELIEYFPALLEADSEVRFLIVGDGPQRQQLEETVRAKGLSDKIIFTGMVPHDQVYRYYQAGDLFVCASTFETQGMTYVEALANGLPLVCRQDKCLLDVIEPGDNGYTYTDCEEFVRWTRKILSDPQRRKRMAAFSLEQSKRFYKDVFVHSVEALYQDILNKHIGLSEPLEPDDPEVLVDTEESAEEVTAQK